MLGFHSAQLGQQSCQLYAPASIYPKEIPLFLLLFEVEWNPRLLNADRKNSSLENFQGPYRESNPEPPVFWQSVSTNCTTRPKFYVPSYMCSILKRF